MDMNVGVALVCGRANEVPHAGGRRAAEDAPRGEEHQKLHVKFGDAEFCGEGPVAIVNAQYDRFLKWQEDRATARAAAPPPPPPPPRTITSNAAGASAGALAADQVPSSSHDFKIDAATLPRLFALDKDSNVSRKLSPTSEYQKADTILLILYGFLRMTNQEMVPSLAVMQAAQKSSATVDRVDKALRSRDDFYYATGNKRGKRYGLNHKGVAFAEDLIRATLEA